MKQFSLLLSLIAFLSFSQNSVAQSQLPDLTLSDINGNPVNLSDLANNGKITVISFWATWCIPCQKELNNIAEIYEDWQEEWDVEVVAVSTDNSRNAHKVKPIVDARDWPFLVLMDLNEDFKRAIAGATAIPYTIVLDKEGNIVKKHSGYQEGDEFELEEVFDEIG